MNIPTVSIIIPTYNRQNMVGNAIESVLSQDYQNIYEILITDDNSTDDTEYIISKYAEKDSRIKYIKNTKYCSGPVGNKKNGLNNIDGEFIVILDDDDILYPDAISSTIQIYLEKGYKIILANCTRSNDGKYSGKHHNKNDEVSLLDVISNKYSGDYFWMWHKSISRDIIFYTEVWGGEHLSYWMFLKKTPAYYLHKSVKQNTIGHDQVSKNYTKHPKRSYLIYTYTIDLFGNDMLSCDKNIYIKNCIMASFYARLSYNIYASIKYAYMAWTHNLLNPIIFGVLLTSPIPIPPKIGKIMMDIYLKIMG